MDFNAMTDMPNFINITTPIKTHLLRKDWADAIVLLDYIVKNNPNGFEKWTKNKSTLFLRDLCEPFRNFSYYRNHRIDPMPFENDVSALDATIIGVLK